MTLPPRGRRSRTPRPPPTSFLLLLGLCLPRGGSRRRKETRDDLLSESLSLPSEFKVPALLGRGCRRVRLLRVGPGTRPFSPTPDPPLTTPVPSREEVPPGRREDW